MTDNHRVSDHTRTRAFEIRHPNDSSAAERTLTKAGIDGFTDMSQYAEALRSRDKKGRRLYETDPDYRALVDARLNAMVDAEGSQITTDPITDGIRISDRRNSGVSRAEKTAPQGGVSSASVRMDLDE